MFAQELKENTVLVDPYFPFNVFHNQVDHHEILHLHWHEHMEMIYIHQGQAVFEIGNQVIQAGEQDVLFVNSRQLHTGHSLNDTGVTYTAIVFNPSLLGSPVPDPYQEQCITPFIEGKFLLPNLIRPSEAHYPLFASYIHSIIQEYKEQKPGFELAVKSYLYLIITLVFRYYIPKSNTKHAAEQETNRIRFHKVISFIEQNYAEKITVEQAAKMTNLNPHHFCKTFKKVTGRTFVEFVNLYRINEAEKMLRFSTLPITEIAERVGFSNINYFDKVFKKYRRYAPSQCRRGSESIG